MTSLGLGDLNWSSAQFPDQLDRILHHAEFIQALPEDELAGLLKRLNDVRLFFVNASNPILIPCSQALGQLDYTSKPFRKCVQVLQEICSLRATLPASYQVSGVLSFVSEQPVAFGGFGDVFKGRVGTGADVCIKKIRVCSTDDVYKLRQAGPQFESQFAALTDGHNFSRFVRRLQCGNI
jgi:hypothetical protein